MLDARRPSRRALGPILVGRGPGPRWPDQFNKLIRRRRRPADLGRGKTGTRPSGARRLGGSPGRTRGRARAQACLLNVRRAASLAGGASGPAPSELAEPLGRAAPAARLEAVCRRPRAQGVSLQVGVGVRARGATGRRPQSRQGGPAQADTRLPLGKLLLAGRATRPMTQAQVGPARI